MQLGIKIKRNHCESRGDKQGISDMVGEMGKEETLVSDEEEGRYRREGKMIRISQK